MAGARKERSSDRPNPTAIQRASLAMRTSDGENWSMAFCLRCRCRSARAPPGSREDFSICGAGFLCNPLDWLDVTPSLSRAQLGARRYHTPSRLRRGAVVDQLACERDALRDRVVGQNDEHAAREGIAREHPTWAPWSKRSWSTLVGWSSTASGSCAFHQSGLWHSVPAVKRDLEWWRALVAAKQPCRAAKTP